MLPWRQRLHAVINQATGPAPDQHITMAEQQMARALLAREPAPEKGARQAQRDGNNGRSKVGFVVIAVQAHARAAELRLHVVPDMRK